MLFLRRYGRGGKSLGALLLGCVLALGGCGRQEEAAPAASAEAAAQWRDHLSEYTQGWIGAEAPLLFRFSHPVVGAELLNRPLDGIVRLEPAQDVVAVFTATDTMELRHPERFASGARLEVILSPDKLQGMPAGLAPLRYAVQVLEQGINLRERGLVARPGAPGHMLFEGSLETTDAADPAAVERVVQASQGGVQRRIGWRHVDARQHEFTVQDVQRGSADGVLLIRWDGAPLGVGSKGERSVEVPALRAFELTSALAVAVPDPHVELRFSEPLDAAVNLDGAVTLNGRNARLQVDGNVLRAYDDSGMSGTVRVRVMPIVRASGGAVLAEEAQRELEFATELPGVRFADRGHILPAAERVTIPIEAVAVKSVLVRAFEIRSANIRQYLQQDDIGFSGRNARWFHRDTGRYLWQKTLVLPRVPMAGWERFDLDVDELMHERKGSLVRLELQVLPQDSAWACADAPEPVAVQPVEELDYDGEERPDPVPERLRRYYESAGYYEWSERNNPCHGTYYRGNENTNVSQMFFASSIGVLAKQGSDRTLHVVATDLRTARALPGAEVDVFNYQQQRIGGGTTDADGMATLALEGVPFTLSATKDGDTAWLKVSRNEALPTAQFDTGGSEPQQGVKGFIYGERDIWRPGDTIHLAFILQDRESRLPPDYPVTLELFDPRGTRQRSITSTTPVGGFHVFELATEESAPTGNWRAIVRIGDRYFDRIVKIENIAPNHLKMDLALPADGLRLADMPVQSELRAEWLSGASAAGLRADVQVRLSAGETRFEKLQGWRFDDAARSFTQEPRTVFEGKLDEDGIAVVALDLAPEEPPPGVLNAVFTQRVFEPGGQFSTQYRSAVLWPFDTWVGVHAPTGDAAWHGALDKDGRHTFDFLSLDSRGNPVAGRNLEFSVHAIDWRWWWDDDGEDLGRYVSDSSRRAVDTGRLRTGADGRASWIMDGPALDWGRYLVRVCDADASGARQHCASQEVYLGWGFGGDAGRDAATRMGLSTDRDRYEAGQTATIRLPPGPDREVLVSLENGDRVLRRFWQPVREGEDRIAIPVTPEMAPNVYVYVAQLQPHQGRDNDLPIRQYGIVPLLVDDPGTHLAPRIEVPGRVRPQGVLPVKLSEGSGRAMTYTLAVVDEGLLGITDYHVQDPHDAFYRRESLGVRTWDLYDDVIGAYGAELARLLALGGSETLLKRDANRERRYPPVVKFLGPFSLAAGASASHEVALPPYMGQVRVMVVAGDGRAYGAAEQSVHVTQPLNLLTTLPRVLGPGETLDVPVTLFADDTLRGRAVIAVQADGFAEVLEQPAPLEFAAAGEQTTRLRIRVNEQVGTARLTVSARLGTESATETLHVPVRSANLPSQRAETRVLAPGESWSPAAPVFGMPGTNSSVLGVSRAPEFALERRLDGLLQYPHGCVEQTVSAAFPQLFLPRLATLDDAQAAQVRRHVEAAISKLASFQTDGGGFAYWPYQAEVAPWGSDYAGHFLLEARRGGYAVPAALFDKWLDYQQAQARGFHATEAHLQSGQAYRLYTLALADRADTGAMNRLRDALGRQPQGAATVAHRMLALAYLETGLEDVGRELLARGGEASVPTAFADWYYGSALRDEALRLLLLHRLGDADAAWALGEQMARDMAGEGAYSTHATAWALFALARVFGDAAGAETVFALRSGGQGDWRTERAQRTVWRQVLDAWTPGALAVRNDGTTPLYVSLTQKGIPANLEEKPAQEGLRLDARFSTTTGEPLSVSRLPQGTDFVAEVAIANPGTRALENLALSQVVPSGWQIRNARLEGAADDAALDYQDVRDDRVLSYFGLNGRAGQAPAWWSEGARRRGDTLRLRLTLNASFAGRFYLPGWRVEAMYDPARQATVAGQWVEVVPR